MVQIRLSPDLEESARAARTPMTVDELLAHFPEVPRDLRDEPILAEYVKAFGPLLRVAQKPSPCMGTGGDAHLALARRESAAAESAGAARTARATQPSP